MRGGDENNVSSIQPVVYHLRRMAEYCNAAVLLIHHNNRFGSFRGSSAISAGMDLMLAIESAPEGSILQLRTLKSRHLFAPPFCAEAYFDNSETGVEQRFWLTPSDRKPASKRTPQKPVRTNTATEVITFLAQNHQATATQLIEKTGAAFGTIRNILTKLRASGLIEGTSKNKNRKKMFYALSKKGLELTKVLTINEHPLPQDDDD
jgi:predicted transcriptional regulator